MRGVGARYDTRTRHGVHDAGADLPSNRCLNSATAWTSRRCCKKGSVAQMMLCVEPLRRKSKQARSISLMPVALLGKLLALDHLNCVVGMCHTLRHSVATPPSRDFQFSKALCVACSSCMPINLCHPLIHECEERHWTGGDTDLVNESAGEERACAQSQHTFLTCLQ